MSGWRLSEANCDMVGPALCALAFFAVFLLAYVGAPGLWLWLTKG